MPGVLEKQMKKRKKVTSPKKKKNPTYDLDLPVYGEYGDVKRRSLKPPNWLVAIVMVVIIIVGVIYIPAIIYKISNSKELTYKGQKISEIYYVSPNQDTIRSYNEYLQEHPELDFDGDGLMNSQEERQGTNPRKIDSDGDGVNDYLELYKYDTSPILYNNSIVQIVRSKTVEAGKSASSPIKINDVVMWPDDWSSRAYGSVVKTIKGYRFCNFRGWAQFPSGYYAAYRIENGVHVPLKYKTEEHAFRIDGDWEVFPYAEELPTEYELVLFKKTSYLADGFTGKLLAFLLPDQSNLISCRKITSIDKVTETKMLVELPIAKLDVSSAPKERFGTNMNYLSDLAKVYSTLNNGKCLLMSIYVDMEGEVILEVYGYDENGSLLVAEPLSMAKVGKIMIEERVSRIILDDTETPYNVEWYYIKGCGFDSSKKYTKLYYFGAE